MTNRPDPTSVDLPPDSEQSSLGVWTARAIAAIAGIICFALLPSSLESTTRAVAAWDLAVLVLVAEGAFIILRSTPESARLRAKSEDPGRLAILVVSLGASLISLAAAIVIIRQVPGDGGIPAELRAALGIAAILGAWTLLHTAFTLHYARLYYAAPHTEPMLEFRGGPPDGADFAYFSFGIGMTFQVPDVNVLTSTMRRVVLAHQLLSFLYNTAILAFVVNLIAGHID